MNNPTNQDGVLVAGRGTADETDAFLEAPTRPAGKGRHLIDIHGVLPLALFPRYYFVFSLGIDRRQQDRTAPDERRIRSGIMPTLKFLLFLVISGGLFNALLLLGLIIAKAVLDIDIVSGGHPLSAFLRAIGACHCGP